MHFPAPSLIPLHYRTHNADDIRPLMLYFSQSKLIKKENILMMFCVQFLPDAGALAAIIIKFHLRGHNDGMGFALSLMKTLLDSDSKHGCNDP